MKQLSIKKTVLCGMLTAVTVILSQIMLPLPSGIPLTFQTFAVALCGYMLGKKWGIVSIGLYLLLGTVGIPVFSGFRGGIGVLLGSTGGYIFGFVPLSFLCGLSASTIAWKQIFCGIIGLFLCHLSGILGYSIFTQQSFFVSFWAVSLPFLGKDILSVIGACLCNNLLQKALQKSDLL